jgi:hypothetical protein
MNTNIDVCKGGTIPAGATSFTFVNHHTEPCTISGLKMPGWPPTNPVIPAEQNGVPGQLTIQLSVMPAPGKYAYLASCCPGAHPVITIQ